MSSSGDDPFSNTVNTVGHWVDEGLGEISGRNKRRGEEADARKIQAEALVRENARNQQLMELMQNDVNASNAAAATLPRTPRVPGSARGASATAAQPLGTVRDFLGR